MMKTKEVAVLSSRATFACMRLFLFSTAAMLGGAAVAAAQCHLTANSADFSVAGALRFQSGTTQQSCPSGTTTRVEAWISGHTSDCPTEVFDSQGNCVNESSTGNAVLTLTAGSCGSWTGRSNHRWRAPLDSTFTTIQTNRSTSLNAGSCVPDCSVYGVDYYWNGYECTNVPSPIIIPTGRGASYKLTSAEGGVSFDIDGDGDLDGISWTAADAELAFLALDRNGDGLITSGYELFGNYTVPGINNGFEALASLAMDSNGGIRRGSVSSEDPLFERLLLWTDSNHNGISEASELRPAGELFSEIGVGYRTSRRRDQYGNVFAYRGWVHERTGPGRNEARSADEDQGRTRQVWDVFLVRRSQ